MSTRCQIGFYKSETARLQDWEALIYRHYDGYPKSEDGVPETIGPILKEFDKDRGLSDLEYASAWLVAKLNTDYLNIGISKHLHGDIEWFYHVSPTKIRVFKVIRKNFHVSFKKMEERLEYEYNLKETK